MISMNQYGKTWLPTMFSHLSVIFCGKTNIVIGISLSNYPHSHSKMGSNENQACLSKVKGYNEKFHRNTNMIFVVNNPVHIQHCGATEIS